MHMAIGVQQHVVRFDVSVNNALLMHVTESAAKLGDPEADGRFGEVLPRDVEAQVSPAHEIDNKISDEALADKFRANASRLSYK